MSLCWYHFLTANNFCSGIKEPPSASNANHSPSQRLSMNDTLVEAINQPSPTVDQFPGSQPMPAPLPSYGSFRGTRIVNNLYVAYLQVR